jgi:hypothetical protein
LVVVSWFSLLMRSCCIWLLEISWHPMDMPMLVLEKPDVIPEHNLHLEVSLQICYCASSLYTCLMNYFSCAKKLNITIVFSLIVCVPCTHT